MPLVSAAAALAASAAASAAVAARRLTCSLTLNPRLLFDRCQPASDPPAWGPLYSPSLAATTAATLAQENAIRFQHALQSSRHVVQALQCQRNASRDQPTAMACCCRHSRMVWMPPATATSGQCNTSWRQGRCTASCTASCTGAAAAWWTASAPSAGHTAGLKWRLWASASELPAALRLPLGSVGLLRQPTAEHRLSHVGAAGAGASLADGVRAAAAD